MTYSNTFTSQLNYPAIKTTAVSEKKKFSDILLMYFVLMISGNPYFGYKFSFVIISSVIIFLGYAFTKAYRKISYKTALVFTFLLAYELMHAWIYDLDYSLTIFKLALVLLLAFSTAQILGNRFISVLSDTMCIIAIISFVFTAFCYVPGIKWSLYNLAMETFPMHPGFKKFVTPTLLVYTFHTQYFLGEFSYVRNAGIFWESGAFAVFLNLTLFLIYISKPIVRLKDLFDKQSCILIIAVITTTSTMGFLALVLILTFFTMKLRTPLKYLLFAIVILTAYFSFVSIDFLGEKISAQLEESDERNNRFGAAMMDWEDIKKRPFIGSSRRLEVIHGDVEMTNALRRPNGLTNFLREYGLIYFTIYFILIYNSFNSIHVALNGYHKPSVAVFGVVLLWILSFSEIIFDLTFFKLLIFLSAVYLRPHRAHVQLSYQVAQS